MGGRRIVAGAVVGLCAVLSLWQRSAIAQPEGGEVEMEPAGSGSGSAAPAQPGAPVKDPKVAKKWQAAAVQLVQKGDYFAKKGKTDDAKAQYENAITAFQKAVEASDDLSYYFDIAGVEDKLGKFDDAAKHYRMLATAKEGVKPDLIKKAAAKLDDESVKIGIVTLAVKPEGATVTLGSTELGLTPLEQPLILLPGTYTLSLSAPGFQPKDTEIKVEAGSESERSIELEPIKIVVEPIKPSEVGTVVDTGPTKPNKLPIYVGGGVAAAAFGTAVITGILAVGQHSTYVAKDSTATERADAHDNGKTLALITDLSLGVSLAAGGFTAYYYYYYKYRKPHEKSEPAKRAPEMTKLDVVPWVKPGGGLGGISFGGSF
jgi:hypothetical protein